MDLNPVTDPDAQEALSLRYSNIAVIVVPLSSGRYAILDRAYELHRIYDSPPTATEVRLLSQEFQTRLHYATKIAEESRFYGEPEDRELARDLKSQRATPKRLRVVAVEIEL